MKYFSLFSGIEAASSAWKPLGWECVGVSEIEPFPCAVLKHHYPQVLNFGDITQHETWTLPEGIDLIVGGSPCQSFSVAGKRGGLDDPRGRLMHDYVAVAERVRPRWIVWENVPGVLSSGNGRDFAALIGSLEKLGYGCAWRILDAQWFGVPQRRRRVFLVGCLGDWTAAASVLFERESLCGHPPSREQARQGAAADAGGGAKGGCVTSHAIAPCLETTCNDYSRADGFTMIGQPQEIAGTLDNRGLRSQTELDGHGAYIPVPFRKSKRAQSSTDDETWVQAQQANTLNQFDTGERDTHAVAHAFYSTGGTHGLNSQPEVSPAIKVGSALGIPSPPAVAFTVDMQACKGNANVGDGSVSPTLCKPSGNDVHAIAVAPSLTASNDPSRSPQSSEVTQQVAAVHAATMTVRRLTPRECERLQGFPDDWTLIPYRNKPADLCPDGPRYKALGNSMAVPCMRWIGERIEKVSK